MLLETQPENYKELFSNAASTRLSEEHSNEFHLIIWIYPVCLPKPHCVTFQKQINALVCISTECSIV